jgi:molybdopterin synthase catalytic subunit
MDISELITTVKRHPDHARIGMILCHNGVVRATSRDGRPVSGLRVRVDRKRLSRIIADAKKQPGIVEVLVEIDAERDLSVGEDVMLLVVAGDIRDHVLATLSSTLEAIKTTVTSKTEYFRP